MHEHPYDVDGPADASPLQLAIEVPWRLERSDRADPAALSDAEAAALQPLARTRPVAALQHWLAYARARATTPPPRDVHIALDLIMLAVVVFGAGCGILTTLGALFYDGSRPINVLLLLALLPGLQLLLLTVSLLQLLPGMRLTRAGGILPAGVLARALTAWRPGRDTDGDGLLPLRWLFEDRAGRSAAAERVRRWLFMYWQQASAAAFNLGALLAAAATIVFTDLAFGWSTTLQADAAGLQRLTDTICLPWSAWLPAAVPDADLIERSRVFRLDGDPVATDPGRLTGWWPFVLMSLFVYGLLPRLALLLLARWRLARAQRAMLRAAPRVNALIDALAAPRVRTGSGPATGLEPVGVAVSGAGNADDGPVLRTDGPATAGAATGLARLPRASGEATIFWADAPGAPVGGANGPDCWSAGAGSLDRDDAAAAGAATCEGRTWLLCAAWEPPMLEFRDFLASLREHLGPGRPIVIVPLDEQAGLADARETRNWIDAADATGDPHTHVFRV